MLSKLTIASFSIFLRALKREIYFYIGYLLLGFVLTIGFFPPFLSTFTVYRKSLPQWHIDYQWLCYGYYEKHSSKRYQLEGKITYGT